MSIYLLSNLLLLLRAIATDQGDSSNYYLYDIIYNANFATTSQWKQRNKVCNTSLRIL
jgi:hypothetical protein